MKLILILILFLIAPFSYSESLFIYNQPVSKFIRWYSVKNGIPVILKSPDIKIIVFANDIHNERAFFINVLAAYGYYVIPSSQIMIVCNPADC